MAYTFYRISYHHLHKDDVLKDILRYSDTSASIMICLETSKNPNTHKKTKGEHYHICVENPFDWKNYRNTILVNKYKLIGKTMKDQPSEYCLTHKVKDEDRFKVYMVKEKNNNNIYRNIDLKTIQDYIERSYPKVDIKSFQQKLMEYLETMMFGFVDSNAGLKIQDIEMEIINYICLHGKESRMACSRSRVTSYATQFIMYHIYNPYNQIDHEHGLVHNLNFSEQRYHYIMHGIKNSMNNYL